MKKIEEIKNKPECTAQITYEPEDYSDVGQASVLSKVFPHCLCHCDQLGWMVYKDGIWVQSDSDAQGYSQELTNLQRDELYHRVSNHNRVLSRNNSEYEYEKYITSRRSTTRISATLREAVPMLNVELKNFDADPLILNTPTGEIHLDTGEVTSNEPSHYITHITTVSPSDEGMEQWETFLNQISCGDESFVDFLQQVVGMAAIGGVYEERLIIAHGSGGNGKSSFFEAIQGVLGDYAGSIRPELLIDSNDSGKKFEYVALRGKRFILTEELKDGHKLDTSSLKQLCSTGNINAQYKGKDVFFFKPTHSTVMCTNYLPQVKSLDKGTWDRLLVVPFNGRFRGTQNEIKKYGGYLAEHCGGAILKWVVEGAQKYIQNQYKLRIPQSILDATRNYRKENDWTLAFYDECLEEDPDSNLTGIQLYNAYQEYCNNHGIKALASNVALPTLQKELALNKSRNSQCTIYHGIKIVA